MEYYILIIIIPVSLTVLNIYNLFSKKKSMTAATDIMVFTLGPALTLLLYGVFWHPLNWQESITHDWLILNFHEPITNYPVILTLAVIAITGYAILRIRKRPMPPLITAICLAAVYIGCALSLLFILQLTPHIANAGTIFYFEAFGAIFYFEAVLMCLFPLNFIISSIALTRRIVKQAATLSEKNEYKSGFMKWCKSFIVKSTAVPVAAFVIMWPLLVIIIAVLSLFGQRPDAAIKAFTDTSDWLLSQHVSPAIGPYGSEYLCTAAARGHESIVKPLRKGIRGGWLIVVNRQLCVANAFEELLQEKTPRFRRLLRRVYDAVGCPIARRIKTPIAADIAYIVIKPLEWLLLIILYLVEAKPEDRIARQYLPKV